MFELHFASKIVAMKVWSLLPSGVMIVSLSISNSSFVTVRSERNVVWLFVHRVAKFTFQNSLNSSVRSKNPTSIVLLLPLYVCSVMCTLRRLIYPKIRMWVFWRWITWDGSITTISTWKSSSWIATYHCDAFAIKLIQTFISVQNVWIND